MLVARLASFAPAAIIFLALALAPSPAHADGENADALFNAGRALMQEGRFAEACPKFAQSHRVAPSVGTVLNLGLCLEKLGQNASAVTAYRDAITMATAMGPAEVKRVAVARERIASLEPHLTKLQIAIAEEAPGLEVRRDGQTLPKNQFGVAVPVDPIAHTIEAAAPNKVAWKMTITISGDAATTNVTIPPLVDAPKAQAVEHAPPPPSRPAAPEPTERPILLTAALGGGGIAALAAGVVLAIDAKSKYDDAEALCDGSGCDPRAQSIQDGAVARGNVATVLVIAGAAALASAGVVWFVLFPPGAKTAGTSRLGVGVTGAVFTRTF